MGAAEVILRFAVTSLLMWTAPLCVLYAFQEGVLPAFQSLSAEARTLWSGLAAVLAVNIVIVVYIVMALRDPPTAPKPQPDPAFAAAARASIGQAEPDPTVATAKKDS